MYVCVRVCEYVCVWCNFSLWYLSRYVGKGHEGKRRDLEEARRDDGGTTDKHTANTQVTWASHCRLEISWRFPMGFLATGTWLKKLTRIGTSTNWGSQQVLVPLLMTWHPHRPTRTYPQFMHMKTNQQALNCSTDCYVGGGEDELDGTRQTHGRDDACLYCCKLCAELGLWGFALQLRS